MGGARRSGDDDAWRQWWQTPDSDAYYFMGKDNIVFHAEIWPAQLLGYDGEGDKGGTPGSLGRLNLPTEVVSSEFLTMEGRKFSSSRQVVIYVRDFLARYDADALRYFIAAAGPENQDTDFTWAEFLRRNNDELVAGWGNLVNRSVSMAAKNVGAIPTPGALTDADRALLETTRSAFGTVGELLGRNRQKAAATEAMRVVGEANKYLSDQAPWKLKEDPARRDTVLHTALQAVSDCNALLTPFLPHSAQKVHELLGGTGVWSPEPRIEEVTDLDDGSPYPIITGDHSGGQAVWASRPLPSGTPLSPPTPVFKKLDESIVEEELRRLAGDEWASSRAHRGAGPPGEGRARTPARAWCEPVGRRPRQSEGREAAVPRAAPVPGGRQPHAPRHHPRQRPAAGRPGRGRRDRRRRRRGRPAAGAGRGGRR